jgi:murein DD-endopeptidase MepM/ murein hydrolase activator NlpD
MRFPFDGSFPVNSPWGEREGGFHRGIDFGLPEGTPVVSVGDGVVFAAQFETDGGNHLVILLDSPPDPSAPKAGYMHLQGFAVQVGQRVSEGQVVGISDTTGASVTGPHLHFWMGSDANVGAVDPTGFFGMQSLGVAQPRGSAPPPLPDFNKLLAAFGAMEGDTAVAMVPDYFGNEISLHVNKNGDLIHNSFGAEGGRTPADEVLLNGCDPTIQPAARVANDNLIVTCVGNGGNLRRLVFLKAEGRWDTSAT